MSIKFFGQFLLERRVITASDLLEAVRFQEENNMKFGDYVRARGYLEDVEIRRLNEEQKRTDLRIGEVAVKLGILSQERVDEILTMQKNDHMFIGEALVKKGFISHERLVSELDLFRDDQREYMIGEIGMPAGIRDREMARDCVDLTQKMLRRIAGISVKAGPGLRLFKDPDAVFSAVSIALAGSRRFEYVFCVDRPAAERIASSVLGSDASAEPEDVLIDGVKEFANIVCGNIMAKGAKRGLSLSISPPLNNPYLTDGYNIIRGRMAVQFVLQYAEGGISLIVIES